MERVTAVARRYVDAGRYPGTITVVARRDEVVCFDAYGRSDVERDRPMRADTIFRIYSMTKPIVSLGLNRSGRTVVRGDQRAAAGSLSADQDLRAARNDGHRVFGA